MPSLSRLALSLALALGAPRVHADPPRRIVAIGGFALTVASLRETRTRDDVFSDVRSIVASADLALGHLTTELESVAASTPSMVPSTCAGVRVVGGLGVDLLSLTHPGVRSAGPEGALTTQRCVLAAQIAPVGLGASEDAAPAPWRTELGDLRVGVLAFSEGEPSAPLRGAQVARLADRAAEVVRSLRSSVDALLVSVQWDGAPHDSPSLTAAQIARAHALIDAGADAVIGHHPSGLRGAEVYRGRPIAYSLGTFFAPPRASPRHDGAVLTLSLERATRGRSPVCEAALLPLVRLGRQARPYPAVGPLGDAARALVRRESLRLGTRLRDEGGVLHLPLRPAPLR